MVSPRNESPLHPGQFIKESILPIGITVKAAAERLGVGRPALSNLLNGNSSLSQKMAMRIERTFDVDSAKLLEMQAQYDRIKDRESQNALVVHRYAIPFHQIHAQQIESWANRIEARHQLAALLRKLINTTGKDLTKVDFPAFDKSQNKGWDGQVQAGVATPWIPLGDSRWEFSCDKKPGNKAQRDYAKRTEKTSFEVRRECTYVVVTPRNWPGKDEWLSKKKTQADWKDVFGFDASDLEQWLEQSIPAQIRMREFLGYTDPNLTTLENCWVEWSDASNPALPRRLFAHDVQSHSDKLELWLAQSPSKPFVVAGETTLETLAFISCAIANLKNSIASLHERAIVFRSLSEFKRTSSNSTNHLAIVDSPEVELALGDHYKKTHTIIVRTRNSIVGNADIELNLIQYDHFFKTLRDIGLVDSHIRQLARDSALSPTLLRRQLSNSPAVKLPSWTSQTKVKQSLIPFMLIGTWDTSRSDDKEILHVMTSAEFDDTEYLLAELLDIEESPVWSIGVFRGIVSKLDAFYCVRDQIRKVHIENFLFVAEVVLSEENPALDLPISLRWAAELYGKSRKHSKILRQSICNTLALLAVHGDNYIRKSVGFNICFKIDNLIRRLLVNTSATTWFLHENDLPLYAEAAPETFLTIVENELRTKNTKLKAQFNVPDGNLLGHSPRSSLLWSLESLAWVADYLPRVTNILAKLCQWEITDNKSHTPMNSLKSIFCVWFPQTSASLEMRNQLLTTLNAVYPSIGWEVCLDQFKLTNTIGNISFKPRWRNSVLQTTRSTTTKDAYLGQRKAIQLAIERPDHDEQTLGALVSRLRKISTTEQDLVLNRIYDWCKTGPTDMAKARLLDAIREQIHLVSNKMITLNKNTCNLLINIRERLMPENVVARNLWLFSGSWHVLSRIERDPDQTFESGHKKIHQLQSRALREICEIEGVEGIKDLCRVANSPGAIGYQLKEVLTENTKSIKFITALLSPDSEENTLKFDDCISSFLSAMSAQPLDRLLRGLLDHLGEDQEAVLHLLLCSPINLLTWRFVDELTERSRQEYWRTVTPRPTRAIKNTQEASRLVDELIRVKRSDVAFQSMVLHLQLLDSTRLITLLHEVANGDFDQTDAIPIARHDIIDAIEVIESRGDVSKRDLSLLELKFIEALTHTKHGIRNLQAELAESPQLFNLALASVFKRSDGREDPSEWHYTDERNRTNAARIFYTLLTEAKLIPGTELGGRINAKKLRNWIHQVRILAEECCRSEIGDEMIGQFMAHCSADIDDGIWPTEPVRTILEEIASTDICRGMQIAKRNARGITLREQGGSQERKLATKYRSWSKALTFRHPFVANMLNQMATSFEHEASMWDEDESLRNRTEL